MMKKKIFWSLVAIYLVFLLTRITGVFGNLTGIISSLLYWLGALVILGTVWVFELKTRIILYGAWGLTALGAIMDVLGVYDFGESILRIAFVFWLLGFLLTLVKREDEDRN